MSNADVPIWEKYTLTIDEAAKYFRIGENKLRKLAEENPAAGWVIMNGNRIQIKRKQFEKMIILGNIQSFFEFSIFVKKYFYLRVLDDVRYRHQCDMVVEAFSN